MKFLTLWARMPRAVVVYIVCFCYYVFPPATPRRSVWFSDTISRIDSIENEIKFYLRQAIFENISELLKIE